MDPDRKNTIVSCFNDYSGRNTSLAFLCYLYTSARFTFANCSTECRTCNIPTPNTALDSKKILTPITLTFCRYSTDLAIRQTEKKLHSCLFIVFCTTRTLSFCSESQSIYICLVYLVHIFHRFSVNHMQEVECSP